jgi:hypothetical protein
VDYIIYLPSGGDVTVDLSAASSMLQVEWIHPTEGTVTPGKPVDGGVKRAFSAPLGGSAVLFLSTPTISTACPYDQNDSFHTELERSRAYKSALLE